MVKLPEWRGKEVFRRYGIPIPAGEVVRSARDAEELIRSGRVPTPCVIKAQVLAGGRGKGGAVRFAATPEEARSAAEVILGLEFKGERVKEVLVEEKLSIEREFYVSITLDRSLRSPILMVSREGGVDVELATESSLGRIAIHPFAGLTSYEKRSAVKQLGLAGFPGPIPDRLFDAIWKLFLDEDAELVEINPLALVGPRLIALDAKVVIEDDAAFRHPNYADIRDDRTPLEEIAREKDIAFVQLDGDIGVIANGAGLTMATLDVLAEFGGHPGVFLDLGGTDDPRKVTEAFLLMAQAHPAAVFLNIFGGVTRCDTVARGLVEAMDQLPRKDRFPLVARIRGNNEAEGVKILREAGITATYDLKESVQSAIHAAEKPPRLPAEAT